jgi:hypothetical protein
MRISMVGFCFCLLFVIAACSSTQVVDSGAADETLETARYEVFGMD